MLLKTYLDVPVGLGSLMVVLAAHADYCFVGLAERAVEDAERLLAEARLADLVRSEPSSGADGVRRPRVQLRLGDVHGTGQLVSVPLSLSVTGDAGMPSLHGTLDAAGLGAQRTYLSLSLQSDDTPGLIARTLQRAVYQRVVEVAMHRFLANLAERLLECVANAGGATNVSAESAD